MDEMRQHLARGLHDDVGQSLTALKINLETIKNSRQWMSIIHVENKVNDFAGFGRVDPAVLHDFITDPTDCKQIQDALIPETQWKIKSMSNGLRGSIAYNEGCWGLGMSCNSFL